MSALKRKSSTENPNQFLVTSNQRKRKTKRIKDTDIEELLLNEQNIEEEIRNRFVSIANEQNRVNRISDQVQPNQLYGVSTSIVNTEHPLGFINQPSELPSNFLDSPIQFPVEAHTDNQVLYDQDHSWSHQANTIFALIDSGLPHIDSFGLEPLPSQAYPNNSLNDQITVDATEPAVSTTKSTSNSTLNADNSPLSKALTPSISELDISEQDIGKIIFYIYGENIHHQRLNLNIEAYGKPRTVHQQVKATITTELEFQDEYTKLYYQTRNQQQFKKKVKKRRNPLHDQSNWEPESIYKAYTTIKPKYFDKSDYPNRVPQSSCFGKINMRGKGAWSRSIVRP